MKDNRERCGTCQHGAPTERVELLECQRSPPALFEAKDGPRVIYPLTAANWWCGGWRRRTGAEHGTSDGT